MKNMVKAILLWVIKNKQSVVIDRNYMRRWFIIPKNRHFNIYLHYFTGSDAPIPHDHPWISLGLILQGEYKEHMLQGYFTRRAGSLTLRGPKHLHWIEIDKPVYTLFITGPKLRRWGFQCADRWIDARDYIYLRGRDRLASGCGEDQ